MTTRSDFDERSIKALEKLGYSRVDAESMIANEISAEEFRRRMKWDRDYSYPLFNKIATRLGESLGYGFIGLPGDQITMNGWAIRVPREVAESLTTDTAPELERRLTLALRILKEGK
jgi:hypothetical protein